MKGRAEAAISGRVQAAGRPVLSNPGVAGG